MQAGVPVQFVLNRLQQGGVHYDKFTEFSVPPHTTKTAPSQASPVPERRLIHLMVEACAIKEHVYASTDISVVAAITAILTILFI